MNSALILTYAATVALLVATPGPVVALVVNTASVAGPRRALWTALGTHVASLLLIALAAGIISGGAALDVRVLHGLSLCGSVFIGVMALRGLRELRVQGPSLEGGSVRGGVLGGLLVGVANPKDIIFFVSFFPQFIGVTDAIDTSLVLLALLWGVIDLLVLVAYILVFSRLARRAGRQLAGCSAVVLLLVAVLGLSYSLQALLQAPALAGG